MSRHRILITGVAVMIIAALVLATRGSTDATAADVVAVARTPVLQSFVTASGEIVATRFADIGSASMGRLVSLRVREGDRVTAGQTLARIDPVQAASSADAATAGLRALEAEVQGAVSQITASQAELAAAMARADEADTSLRRSQELRDAGLIAPSSFDAVATTAEAARAQVRAARAAVQRLEQARSAAERRVAQGRAELARARDQVDKTDITAPIDGVVTRLDVEEGEMVVIGIQNQPGTILMTISDLSSINAEVKVAEADVLRLSVGNAATATLEALPGTTFSGRVVEIGASALPTIGTQAAVREFKVKVQLEGDLERLRPGLTCDAEILVASRANILTVPLQSLVQRSDPGGSPATGVFVVRDGVARFTPVTAGIIGGLTVEVEGVAEGAQVIAGPFQVLREIQDGAPIQAK